MTGLKNNILNNNIAGDTSNILVPDASAIKNGIEFKSNINSNVLNGYYNLLSESLQFLQFTGGLYSKEANYDEGNITSLVIKNGEDYSIWQFRRNANNPQVLNNNPPITGASITTVNGVDAYEGGSLNTDWDKLTEDYAVEATPNTVMGRDGEGASNVNMPSSIENTTVVNNEYLQQELQAGLAAKQDKLTAGTNVEITEDNVINVKGDVATDAESVSYDNSNTNLQYITGYDFPKFKYPISDTINLVLTDFNMTAEYPATITKQEDGSYVLNASINNIETFYGNSIGLLIKSIEASTENIEVLNIINIFWKVISSDEWTANNGDIKIEGIEDALQFEFLGMAIFISKTDSSEFVRQPYNITLTIKNRQFHPYDIYFLGLGNTSKLSYLNLQNNNGTVKLVGTINGTGTSSSENTSSYSFLNNLGNYFNLVSAGSYTNTNEITSSTGKAVKYYFMQNASYENVLDLIIAYQDGSTINTNDIFTLNLTPDKNSTVDPIYSPADNVQEAIEAIVLNRIAPIGCHYTQYAEEDGTFDDNKSPENLFGGVWQLMYANEGVAFITEGGFSDENRVNGIQEDAIKNIMGYVGHIYSQQQGSSGTEYGALYWGENTNYAAAVEQRPGNTILRFDASKIVRTGSNVRMKNRRKRIFFRIA